MKRQAALEASEECLGQLKCLGMRQTGGTQTSVRGPEPPLSLRAQFTNCGSLKRHSPLPSSQGDEHNGEPREEHK